MGTVLVEYPSCRDENNHNTCEKDVAHDIHNYSLESRTADAKHRRANIVPKIAVKMLMGRGATK